MFVSFSFFFYFLLFSLFLLVQITPKSIWGRYVLITLLIVMLSYVPIQSAKIFQAARMLSSELGQYRKSRGTHHIVLTGTCTYENVKPFVIEFFHKSHANFNTHVVLLSDKPISRKLSLFLKRTEYVNK